MVAAADLTTPEVQAYLRRRAGLAPSRAGLSGLQRLVRSPWAWTGLILIALGIISLWLFFADVMSPIIYEDGSRVPGLNADALWLSAGKALPTMVFWILCFILVDRYRPQRLLVWLIALGWGGSIAVLGSYNLNNWVGEQMAVVDATSGSAAMRVAVFVAPFVEEMMKGCVIFLIVALDRNRFTSRVSGAVVGGLAGAGFAFTENIIYFARVVVYGSYTSGTGDVMAYLDYMVLWRGVYTCFGHPLFTMMIGLGVAFSVATRSKTVRILAPAAGFLFAAFLHMFFNFWVSIIPEDQLRLLLFIGVWPIVILVVFRLVFTSVRQGRTVAARLTDYVTMGWLPASYPSAFSRIRTRAWTLMMSLWHANIIRSYLLQLRATELALLREAIIRGTIDRGGLYTEHELIDEIESLARRGGLADGRGLRPYLPWNSHKRGTRTAPRSTVVNVPPAVAQQSQAPVVKYSVVDSRWKPPS
jgi:RsiW-degrading membrane proteinase PrsW (M82 family)